MSARKKIRNSVFAIDAFSHRKNTVFESLYTRDDIERILSWIRMDTMNYIPQFGSKYGDEMNLPFDSKNGNKDKDGGNDDLGFLNRSSSKKSLNEKSNTATLNELTTKFEHLEEILEEMYDKLDSIETNNRKSMRTSMSMKAAGFEPSIVTETTEKYVKEDQEEDD
jgi:hypothetical protein